MSLRLRAAKLYDWLDTLGDDDLEPGFRATRAIRSATYIAFMAIILCLGVCSEMAENEQNGATRPGAADARPVSR